MYYIWDCYIILIRQVTYFFSNSFNDGIFDENALFLTGNTNAKMIHFLIHRIYDVKFRQQVNRVNKEYIYIMFRFILLLYFHIYYIYIYSLFNNIPVKILKI